MLYLPVRLFGILYPEVIFVNPEESAFAPYSNPELRRTPLRRSSQNTLPGTRVNKAKSKGWAMRKPMSNSRREQEPLRR
jgi:hypothetical protein